MRMLRIILYRISKQRDFVLGITKDGKNKERKMDQNNEKRHLTKGS